MDRSTPGVPITNRTTKSIRIDPRFLAGMLGIEPDTTELWEPGELGRILAHQMRAPLGEDDQLIPKSDEASDRPSFSGVLYCDSSTLKDIQKIKDFAKANREGKRSGLPPEVATVIYYAAIAAGILIGRREITALGDSACVEGFEWSLKQPWIDANTQSLLERGRDRLAIVI